MPPKPSNTLTEAELRIMRVLWRRGASLVSDVLAAMPAEAPLAYNSVLTTIRILEGKGYVTHREQGRAFLYSARVAEQEASRTEVRHVLGRFFGNSRERLLLSLLGEEGIRAEELERLRATVAEAGASGPEQDEQAPKQAAKPVRGTRQ